METNLAPEISGARFKALLKLHLASQILALIVYKQNDLKKKHEINL